MQKLRVKYPFLTALLAADLLLLLALFAGSSMAKALKESKPDYRETAARQAQALADTAGENLALLDLLREAALAVPCETLRMNGGALFLDGKEIAPARREQLAPGLRALALELQEAGLPGELTARPGEGSLWFCPVMEDAGSDRLSFASLNSPATGEAPSSGWGSGVVPVSGDWEVLWNCTPRTAECGNTQNEPEYLYAVLVLGAVFLVSYLAMETR